MAKWTANVIFSDYAKYLGVMFDSNLAGKYHTQSICHKMGKEKQLKKNNNNKNMSIIALSWFHIVTRVIFFFQYTTH